MAKSVDNYNLNIRHILKYEIRRGGFWFIYLIGFIVCIPIFLIFRNVPQLIGLLFCWTLFMFIAVPMLRFDDKAASTFASSHGFRYYRNQSLKTDASWRTSLHRLDNVLTLFSVGTQRRVEGFMTKIDQQSSIQLSLFRYSFEYKAAKTNNLYQYSVLVLDTTGSALPHFVIASPAVYDLFHFIRPETREKVQVTGINATVYIPKGETSEERLLALSVLTPDVNAILQDYFTDCAVIVDNGIMMILTAKDMYLNKTYDTYMAGLLALLPKVARQASIRDQVGQLLYPSKYYLKHLK